MKVLFLDPLQARLAEFPKRYLPPAEFQVRLAEAKWDLPENLEDVEACVYWDFPLDRDWITRMSSLRFIQRIGRSKCIGDLSAAFDLGIPVSVTPYGVLARVAQHTLAMMLMLSRNILGGHQSVLAGTNAINMQPEYARERPVAFNWAGIEGLSSLSDKTLGIVGFGEAGSVLADLVKPFGMETLYFKRRRLPAGQERYFGIEYAPLDDLLARSDYLVTYLPFTTENIGLLGARELGLLTPGAFFVNTGRANTVNEAAMIQALKSGRLAGAALDVFSYEPLPPNHELRDLPNVILTPHVAGGIGGWLDTFERIARNLRRVDAGLPPVAQFSREAFDACR
jgi:phosphoglycerate dehydrogenase-like enzyme